MSEAEVSKEKKVETGKQASIVELFSFADDFSTKFLFLIGGIFGILNGLVYPALAFLFSTSFTSITGAEENGLKDVEDLAFKFLYVGTYALVCATFQTGCLEIAAARTAHSFRTKWFEALLRQDQSFFDVYNVSGIATSITPNSRKVKRGVGRKLGEGIQFITTALAGIAYALYVSWQVSLVVLAILPFVSMAAFMALKINQGTTSRANEAYAEAGAIAYTTVSSIKTVVSLNALPRMIERYGNATQKAYDSVVGYLWTAGIANASLLGTFIALYLVLTLYGGYLLYDAVRGSGCDPSGAIYNVDTCSTSASDVFGAMLGIAFAGQGVSQVGNFLENFSSARVACFPAMQAINRSLGKGTITICREDLNVEDLEEGTHEKEIFLNEYKIDSSSPDGLKPKDLHGDITFQSVSFSYPTRPGNMVFKDFNLQIRAGSTVALVGPSGGGKSTVVSLIERFYDATNGNVLIDNHDVRDLNVTYLRDQIGLVSQEPVLFATSIAANIAYGSPGATQKEIEEAAKQANAHDFIVSFPQGYNTQVGDKGAQLSGGQKQRIAIARVLIKQPKILVLDEATSALDTESELVVQEALDNLLKTSKRTTLIIAHRLSTIRNADVIAYVANGTVMELGSHDELIGRSDSLYKQLVDKHEFDDDKDKSASGTNSAQISREASVANLVQLESSSPDNNKEQLKFNKVTFAYPTRPDRLVCDCFDLSIQKGETIALVGPSGGGKSTCISLIERFYDPLSGFIEFDGVDIRSLNVPWLRDQIGLVSQEPVLFGGTIKENIAYGRPEATMTEIEQAAKQSNAHDFIMSFKNGYDTEVGERGTQLSGGQKQRIAIARALIKNPKILLLDEATSALDNESEKIVQNALDKIMGSHERTTIVIAHRLSTIKNADRIAFIAGGKVKEIGTHESLISKPNGRYARLVNSQNRSSSICAQSVRQLFLEDSKGDTDDKPLEAKTDGEVDEKPVDSNLTKKAREIAMQDATYLLVGSFGAIMAGLVFPFWGIIFAVMIKMLFQTVEYCEDSFVQEQFGFQTCSEYYDDVGDDIETKSVRAALLWLGLVVLCYVGNVLTFYGYGKASERMNKRIRDSVFSALVRQEMAYFDKQSVGTITSRLQDDTAMIHTFSGEPLRTLFINLASLVTGLVISFVFMWPFALLSIGVIPFMAFATEIEMKTFVGADEGDLSKNEQDELGSPGGILVESLLNIRTVASLNLEKQRYSDYCNALLSSEPSSKLNSFKSGSTSGLSMLVQQYVNALQFWWGGYLLYHYPDQFDFQGFLISMFSLLFSLFGLGAAAMGATDRDKALSAASRIFELIEKTSPIDSLSEEGKKLW